MKYLYLFCLFLLVAGIPISCNFISGQMNDASFTGLWNIASSENPMYTDELKTVFLDLGNDKKYTFYLPDYFDYGTWEVFPEDSLLRLTSARKNPFYGKKWDLHISKMTGSYMKVNLPGAGKLHGLFIDSVHRHERIVFTMPEQFVLYRNEVQFKQKDPFNIAYNNWRIRPDHHESCEELKKRVVNHMRHLQVLFDGYAHSSSETMSYEHSPNPFIMGSNGVGMQSFYDVPDAYNNIFYDRQDVITAYYLTEGFFRQKLNFPKFDKYPELWASVFGQMVQGVDTAHLCELLNSRIERYRKDSALRAKTDTAEEKQVLAETK